MARWNSGIGRHIREFMPLYLFVSILFVMGVAFGSLMVNALSLGQQQDLSRFMNSFFHSVSLSGQGDTHVTIQESFGMPFKWLLLIWLMGLSVVGMPLILILDFLKGVLVGFTVGFLAGHFTWKGVLFALAAVFPQNLFVIPGMLVLSVSAIAFSMFMIKNRFLTRHGSMASALRSYTWISLATVAVVFLACLGETTFSASLIRAVTPMMLQG